MLGDISLATNIYIVTGYTDMRKSIDGLCAIVMDQLKEVPNSHSIYMFCGKRCDRIKVLLREPDGFVLLYKKLDVIQGRYRWPRNKSEVKSITWQQFDWLMSGLDIEQPKALKTALNPRFYWIFRLICGIIKPSNEGEKSWQGAAKTFSFLS